MVRSRSTRRPSLSLRIRITFLALGLTAVAATGVLAFEVAESALETATYERLTGIRETKKRQVESYLTGALAVARAMGREASAVEALQGCAGSWAPSSADYAAVLGLYHEGLSGMALAYGFEDLLLIDGQTGRVVYSARGAAPLGRLMTDPGLAASPLEAALRAVVEQGAPPTLADYAHYPGVDGVAAFAVAEVSEDGERLGILAARLSIATIDEVMTGGGRWREEGLGESGETYLVGSDELMRSDSRFLSEAPEHYFQQLRALGFPDERIEGIRAAGTTVMMQKVETAAVRRALSGETSTSQVADYRGVQVLCSFARCRFATWSGRCWRRSTRPRRWRRSRRCAIR